MSAKRPEREAPARRGRAAAERKAKASVHEAIGKLIGDDDARAHGAAEKDAAAVDRPKP